MRLFLALALTGVFTVSCNSLPASPENLSRKPAAEPTYKFVLASDIQWQPLNPARGDKSPKAGVLWGDLTGSGPSGFLVKFVDGFKSPPHIHNITYRGVVVKGLIHNDDPDAAELWMPAGSFWMQPAGEAHITATKGSNGLAYIEIENGPYLVLPTEKAFDNGERPVNVDPSNIIWLDASIITWVDQPENLTSEKGPKVAFLWGNPLDGKLNGTLVKLPSGFTGKILSHGPTLRAVLIQGQLQYQIPGKPNAKTMDPGSYFSSMEESTHHFSCNGEEKCLIYIRMKGKFEFISGQYNHTPGAQ